MLNISLICAELQGKREREKKTGLLTFVLPKTGPIFINFRTSRTLIANVLNMLGLDMLHHMRAILAGVAAHVARPQGPQFGHFRGDFNLYRGVWV